MRTFFKEPIYELLPPDELNAVPFIYKVDFPFKLVAEYPKFILEIFCKFAFTRHSLPVMIDPTRRLEGLKTFHVFDREEVQMYHMSFVRKDMRMKMTNVSNKGF